MPILLFFILYTQKKCVAYKINPTPEHAYPNSKSRELTKLVKYRF